MASKIDTDRVFCDHMISQARRISEYEAMRFGCEPDDSRNDDFGGYANPAEKFKHTEVGKAFMKRNW